jgi:serine/threonine protein kinase
VTAESGGLKICPQCGTEYELDQRFCPKDGSTLKMQGGTAGDLVGTIIADRYNVLRKLGEGGMGTVYLAEHVKMGRKSALKVMNPGMVNDADAISRFNREAANASRINHANVAAVYDFGETSDGLIYLAMEFVEGPALTRVIEEAGALPPMRAAEITRQAAEALAVAHDMGIVHRDLKPDNIMLAKNRDGSDCVKVVDFGIAKAANNDAQKVTKTGLVVGTPEYMSPEQLAGDKLDGRSDTYSLGLVAFAMLTGKLPFPAETVQESMILRLTDQPKRLGEMKPDLPWTAEVQAVMDKALERDANNRYQSAAEFGRVLLKTITTMDSAMKHAHTSVMGRASVPKKPVAAVPDPDATLRPSATKQVPATRVNPARPSAPVEPPTQARPQKSRAPMFGGIAAVLVVGAVGAYLVLKPGPTDANSSNGTTVPAGSLAGVPTPTPPLNLSRELERLPRTDSTPELARVALAQLAKLDSVAQNAADSTFLQFRFLRGRALLMSGEEKAGCDSLATLEGKLRSSKSRFFKADSALLVNACLQ